MSDLNSKKNKLLLAIGRNCPNLNVMIISFTKYSYELQRVTTSYQVQVKEIIEVRTSENKTKKTIDTSESFQGNLLMVIKKLDYLHRKHKRKT